jgi:hypothetical protein
MKAEVSALVALGFILQGIDPSDDRYCSNALITLRIAVPICSMSDSV